MPRTFSRSKRLSAITEPNVTPLIDLAFSLLIIFMITAPLLEQTITVDLPRQLPTPQEHRREVVHEFITIVSPGAYDWDGIAMSGADIERILRDLPNKDDTAIHIRADRALPYQEVVTLLDIVQRSGIRQVSLDTIVGGR